MTTALAAPPAVTFSVADLFCGAGGSSTGALKAINNIGAQMDLVAVNHWPVAVQTHQNNHPTARHYVEDLDQADPETIVPEGCLDLLMASPECRFHSRARGGKPIHDQGRMHPWVVQRWITSLDVRCVLIENVPEFVDWGPLKNGRPDKTRKGLFFQEWVNSIWRLGYNVEWRVLNAADFGDATTRIRFFLQARNDGRPIRWPQATHSKHGNADMLGQLPRWRAARDIIDWSNAGRSLMDDPKYQRKPLSEKTRRRIARGLERFGGPLAHLYIRLLDLPDLEGKTPGAPQGTGQAQADDADQDQPQEGTQPFLVNRHGENGSPRVHSPGEPMPTVTTRGAGYLVEPEAQPIELTPAALHGTDRQHSAPRSPEEPVHTVTGLTGGGLYVLQAKARPFVSANRNNNAPKDVGEPIPSATTAHGGGSFIVNPDLTPFLLGQQSCGAPRSAEDPTPTVAAAGAISLIRPIIIEYFGQSHARETDSPLSTILSCRKHGLIKPILVEYYGQSNCANVDEPVPAITTRDRHGLANPTLLKVNHGSTGAEDNRTQSDEEPLKTITSKRGIALANPSLVELNHGNGSQGDRGNDRRAHSVDEPLWSITTNPGMALVEPMLVQTSQTGGNGSYVRPAKEPVPTITTRNDMNIVNPLAQPYVVPNFGERDGQQPRVHSIDDPAPAVTSRGAGSLVSPTLAETVIEQLRESRTDPRRLVFINGQPYLLDIRFRMLQNLELARAMGFEDEETSYEFVGNTTQVTKQIGNAVPVNLASALVGAMLNPNPDSQPATP